MCHWQGLCLTFFSSVSIGVPLTVKLLPFFVNNLRIQMVGLVSLRKILAIEPRPHPSPGNLTEAKVLASIHKHNNRLRFQTLLRLDQLNGPLLPMFAHSKNSRVFLGMELIFTSLKHCGKPLMLPVALLCCVQVLPLRSWKLWVPERPFSGGNGTKSRKCCN